VRTIAVSLALLVALGAAVSAAAGPILLGVDNAGSRRSRDLTDPVLLRALDELGINFVVHHIEPVAGSAAMADRLRKLDGAMRRAGLKYMLNVEYSNFVKSFEIDAGVDEFDHPDGTHRWDLRMDWLDPVLAPSVRAGFEISSEQKGQALVGITYDECEHMQLTCNQFATYPDHRPFDRPFLVYTTGKDAETAYNRLVEKCKWLRTRHYRDRLILSTEHVWPDMFHIFARAGWTITPKILKENLSSVVMAISLGAALEYQDSGLQWWVSPDLWCKGGYPGHSPQALKSALLMGYSLGADALYVENLDFGPYGAPHALAPPKGCLIAWRDDGSYDVTPYGEVVRDFYKRHVPEHPRAYSWRDYRPRVAIIRLPDGAWGQRDSGFRDRLLGNKDHPSDDISNEWLQVWPVLTHGVARPGAISTNNVGIYPEYPWPFFVPIDSVAVFDHLVTGPVLDSVECFVVCGEVVSDRTFQDIAKRVGCGATCIISRRLYGKHASGKLAGKWVIVDSFKDPEISAALEPCLGPADTARFRFKDFTVEFRPGRDADSVTAHFIPSSECSGLKKTHDAR
jgi:hypothetical protein